MSIAATCWAWDQALPPTDKLVLLAMCEGGEGVNGAWPSPEAVARMACLTVPDVQRVLNRLERGNWLWRLAEAVRLDMGVPA